VQRVERRRPAAERAHDLTWIDRGHHDSLATPEAAPGAAQRRATRRVAGRRAMPRDGAGATPRDAVGGAAPRAAVTARVLRRSTSMRRLARLVPLLLATAALAGCGADDEQPASARADSTNLTVEVSGAGMDPVTIALRCGGAEPCDRDRLDHLRAVTRPPDPERACTMVYGGPEQARVTGTLDGERVDVTIDRSNGCGIAAYEALFAALGRKPPGAG
jgi:hypothetical protein